MNKRQIIFFIGTEAELIKIFPIMIECKKREIPYKIVASGQNDIVNSTIWDKFDCGEIDLIVSPVRHITTGFQLICWWFRALLVAKRRIKRTFRNVDFRHSIMVVHGDTVSTVMGAFTGKHLGMRVAHVEAGLRSHHLFDPLPEEIDRLLTSRCARIHFAPGDTPLSNLKNAKGIVVNTVYNTLYDSLRYSMDVSLDSEKVHEIINGGKYFVFVMHRQENLMKEDFVREVVNRIAMSARGDLKCVILLHAITRNTFARLGILELLRANPNIILLPRTQYCDFMKLLKHAEFAITDGGSNQEELYYMGHPCLIIRNRSEREEGLGKNATLLNGELDLIHQFISSYKEKENAPVEVKEFPSKMIVDCLEREIDVLK